MVRRVIQCTSVRVNKMFHEYSSIRFGVVLWLSEKYSPYNRISEDHFRRVHWHLPIGMRCIKHERAAHPRNHAFIIGLIISNNEIFIFYETLMYNNTLIRTKTITCEELKICERCCESRKVVDTCPSRFR